MTLATLAMPLKSAADSAMAAKAEARLSTRDYRPCFTGESIASRRVRAGRRRPRTTGVDRQGESPTIAL